MRKAKQVSVGSGTPSKLVRADALRDKSLYRLGGLVPLDGRISWAPKEPGRFQPINCYLVLEPGDTYLIDTGVAAHRDIVVPQLRAILPPNSKLTVALTRSELDCAGNLGSIHASTPIEQIVAPGLRNPFDAYDELSRQISVPTKRQRLAAVTSAVNPLGSSKRVVMIPSRLRILTTYWAYDQETRTLFTTDSFGHTSVASSDAAPFIDDVSSDETTLDSARNHLLSKFDWLKVAHTGQIRIWLEKLFRDYDIEIIAPGHGCMLIGRPMVERHVEMLLSLLGSLGKDAEARPRGDIGAVS